MSVAVTVWMFLIFGASHQAVDNFPSLTACEEFRTNVKQMIDEFGTGRVSECMPRSIVVEATR